MSQKSFSYNFGLDYQNDAVNAIVDIFSDDCITRTNDPKVNNVINLDLKSVGQNINNIQRENGIFRSAISSNIFDIEMQTGTGKTFTYLRTIFELNEKTGLNKFIIVVPDLTVRANTIDFLEDQSTKQQFFTQYNQKNYKLHVVEKKTSSAYMDNGIWGFIADTSKDINILLVNGDKMSSTWDEPPQINLFDNISNDIYELIAATRPIVIIDEPHLFKIGNQRFKKILRLQPQVIIRYGATFDNAYQHLMYQLTPYDAMVKNLVKDVEVQIYKFEEAKKKKVKLISVDNVNKNAVFGINKKEYLVRINQSLTEIDKNFTGLYLDKVGSKSIALSNGVEMTTNETMNAYAFNPEFMNKVVDNCIHHHFELEKEYLNIDADEVGPVRMKPLTLFFIDDINLYRPDKGKGLLTNYVEQKIREEIELLLRGDDLVPYYRQYLEDSLNDIGSCHGGYFSKDNKDKDDKIEQEILEIIHDKKQLLSIHNTRRFIFSKWTLREGWDVPNIFQIAKLRSSGSETSKLQEVGRGLRLPVNENFERDDTNISNYKLRYYADISEQDFTKKLRAEIFTDQLKGYFEVGEEIDKDILEKIDQYKLGNIGLNRVRNYLEEMGIIDKDGKLLPNTEEQIFDLLPPVMTGIDKVRDVGEDNRVGKISANEALMSQPQMSEFKRLWDVINYKMVLNYEFEEDYYFEQLLKTINNMDLEANVRIVVEEVRNDIKTVSNPEEKTFSLQEYDYDEFVERLTSELSINILTIHKAICNSNKSNSIMQYLNNRTIKNIVEQFKNNFMEDIVSVTAIESVNNSFSYKKIDNKYDQDTMLFDKKGKFKKDIKASLVGDNFGGASKVKTYLYNELYYDSEKELENMKTNALQVEIFAKIPKTSIRIPLPNGHTYSPDFAYIVKSDKEILNFVIETKGKRKNELSDEEKQKDFLAKYFYDQLSKQSKMNIEYKMQLNNDEIEKLLGISDIN